MRDTVRAAAVCMGGLPGRTKDNLAAIDEWAARAACEGADLALFPELCVTGFLPNHPRGEHDVWLREALRIARRTAEPLDGFAVNALAGIAKDRGLFIAAGMLEDAGNVLFNTHVLVGPDGLAGAWRKMHVPMYELPFYNGGPAPDVAQTPLGRIGANICFDALMPESARLLAVRQVEIALFPFAADPPPCTPAGWSAWAGPAVRARCVENGIFGVACNYSGYVEAAGAEQRFPGGATIVGPRGDVIAEWDGPAGEPGMIVAGLRAETLREARAEPEYLFRFRRPELYGALAK